MYKLSKLAAGSVIAATAAIGSAGVALADGAAPKGKVVYERPSDWSGVYFGVGSGYQWSNIDVANPAFPNSGFSSDHDTSFVEAHLGVQHQFGNIVLGIEGGWQSALKDHAGSTADCFAAPAVLIPGGVANCSARFNDVLTIGARVGWAAGHWMPYFTGGYANGGFDFIARDRTATAPLIEQGHTRLDGWYVGAGFEWVISPGWTTGLEYRHYDFDSGTNIAFSEINVPRELARFDATTETLTARVSWRWGRPEPVAAPLK